MNRAQRRLKKAKDRKDRNRMLRHALPPYPPRSIVTASGPLQWVSFDDIPTEAACPR